MSFTFAPARRENVGLLIALAGASGSGKTYSALRLAKGMSPSGKIAFIDTEARRGLHYADDFSFNHSDMHPPFRPNMFVEGIRAAEATGAEVVIIDSFSHEYDGEGGIMDWADELADGVPKKGIQNPRKSNSDRDWWQDWEVKPVPSPGNWKDPKGAHKKLMGKLLQCRATVIFCLRADEKIEIIRENNRTAVRPLGWVPICEKRFMYEMTASFTLTPDAPGKPQFNLPHKLQQQHRAFFPENRTIDEQAGRSLAEWARGGAVPSSSQQPSPAPADAHSEQENPHQQLIDDARAAATNGTADYQAFYKSITNDDRTALIAAGHHEQNKATAAMVDRKDGLL